MCEFLSEGVVNTLILVLLLLSFLYYYGTFTYDYWEKRGVPYKKPKYPFFGTSYETAFSLKQSHINQLQTYEYFNNERFGGVFCFTRPALFIRDPALIESVMIKDFSSFCNRGISGDTTLEPLTANLVNLEDMQWKSLRQKLTPTFSSGKLKGMHQQLVDCSEALLNYIDEYCKRSEPIEARKVMGKFSMEVIGSCAFGLNTNSINDKDSEFTKAGRKVFEAGFLRKLRIAIRVQYPKLLTFLRWKGLDQKTENFFVSLVKSTMSYREKNNIVRNDFVQLLMELKKQELENPTKKEDKDHVIVDDTAVAANAFSFLVAGFETIASTLSYCLYEISVNPDVQEQAYRHIVEVLKRYKGELTVDAVKEMPFIKQIFAETLRMHPPASTLRRIVTKNYTIPETNLTLPKGCFILIPTYSLHHDAKYFPQPEKFKPERFVKDSNIRKGTYLPFGDGPRICIGKKFAEMTMQVLLVKILLKYKLTLNPKTISPLVYNTSSTFLAPVGGIWIDFHKQI